MKHTLIAICLSFTTTISSAANAPQSGSEQDPESPFNTVGFRVGFDDDENVSLTSYELYETSDPQWSWDLGEKMSTGIGYEASIGALAGEGEVSAFAHFGFTLELAHDSLPITLIGSTGPSLYSEDNFGDYNIGGHIQFSSSIGLNWQICDGWALDYRFQHTSNAGLKDDNPGLNMHVLGISHNF